MCGFESLLTLIFLTSLSSSLFGLLYSLLILLTLLLYHYLLLKTLSTVLINLFFNLQVFLFIKLVLNLLPSLNHLILREIYLLINLGLFCSSKSSWPFKRPIQLFIF